MLSYIFWLFLEIVKSNFAVCKILWSRKISINQQFLRIPYCQSSELGQVMFANSITLTPGTVTIEIEGKEFLVHALNCGEITKLELSEMDRRVALLEKG
tara:strand:+ start:167 stop:463 length:297 start_codon:yes stop_codon:yes gene_type:complete